MNSEMFLITLFSIPICHRDKLDLYEFVSYLLSCDFHEETIWVFIHCWISKLAYDEQQIYVACVPWKAAPKMQPIHCILDALETSEWQEDWATFSFLFLIFCFRNQTQETSDHNKRFPVSSRFPHWTVMCGMALAPWPGIQFSHLCNPPQAVSGLRARNNWSWVAWSEKWHIC